MYLFYFYRKTAPTKSTLVTFVEVLDLIFLRHACIRKTNHFLDSWSPVFYASSLLFSYLVHYFIASWVVHFKITYWEGSPWTPALFQINDCVVFLSDILLGNYLDISYSGFCFIVAPIRCVLKPQLIHEWNPNWNITRIWMSDQ